MASAVKSPERAQAPAGASVSCGRFALAAALCLLWMAAFPALADPGRGAAIQSGAERLQSSREWRASGARDDASPGEAALEETYWRLDALMGQTMPPPTGRREPHLVLSGEPGRGFRATAGCNNLGGSLDRDGETLRFGAIFSTKMGCPEPLATLERDLSAALDGTRSFAISGQHLELRDGDGAVIAEFTAVYLR